MNIRENFDAQVLELDQICSQFTSAWLLKIYPKGYQLPVSERSLCYSSMSDRKAVVKNADMSEEMQQDAVDCATQALEKYNIEKVSSNF